jgi:hypothetical protein
MHDCEMLLCRTYQFWDAFTFKTSGSTHDHRRLSLADRWKNGGKELND